MNVNRRSFLIASPFVARVARSQSPGIVNTGMIGVGNRGSYLTQAALAQSNAKIVALCDIKPDRLDKAASIARRDNPITYSEWRRVIDRKDVDAVFIATPPYLHAQMAVAALQAGKHVYCEKPIGVNAADVRDIVKAAKATNRVFTAGQDMRSERQLGGAIRKIREGVIGEVIMVKAQRHASADLNHAGSSADWFFDVTKGGGYLIENSIHNLDVCNWAIGAHPTRACGFGGTLLYKNDPPGRTIFDCGLLVYDYPNGAKMSYTQTVFHPTGMPSANQLIYVYGTKGSVDLLYSTTMYSLARGVPPSVLVPKQEEPQHAHITAFYECITKGTPNPADIVVGATGALTSILGHEAMVREKVVNWSDLGVDV